MFIQVIQGQVSDATGLRRQFEAWHTDLRPEASGYLGTTFGLTAEGYGIGMVRFATADDFADNQARAEQQAWWAETEKMFVVVTTHDSDAVDVFLVGGSDRAGFVQVMQGRIRDLARLNELEAEAIKTMQERRPDAFGSTRARYDDGAFTEFIYFTSEDEAREGEASEQSEADAAMMNALHSVLDAEAFYDLPEPWLYSA